jgi:hypothetical protein
MLWAPAPATERPRKAALLRVVDGAVQVPGWMRLWVVSDEDDGEGTGADDGSQEEGGGKR